MKYLIRCPEKKCSGSNTNYFLGAGIFSKEYTNYISKTIHDEIPDWVLKDKDFENKIISSDSLLFRKIIEKEISRLTNLVQNGVSEVSKDIELLENTLKETL